MGNKAIGPLSLSIALERWPVRVPFRITGHTWEHLDVIVVTLGTHGARRYYLLQIRRLGDLA